MGPIANATNLAITEVHYAPVPAGTAAELAVSTDPSDFEYLELQNIGGQSIDLTDVYFADGIEFTFTGSAITTLDPGERVLIVCNLAAFQARYGVSYNNRIAGEYLPSRLDNAGERLHLVDALGNTIADFTYNDKHPWPTQSGFAGYSMVLKSTALPSPDYASAENWRSSTQLGGNPNSSDTSLLAGAPQADDDGDQFDKLLEHGLGTSDSNTGDAAATYSLAIQSLEVDDVLNDYLTITYQRNLSADDVIIVPQISYDLVTWLSGESEFVFVAEAHQGDGTSLVTYRIANPYDPASARGFVRLSVSTL